MALLLSPDEEAVTGLTLTVAEPVDAVEPDEAQSMLKPVDDGEKLAIRRQAQGFVSDLVLFNPNSPGFADKLNDIQTLGQDEVIESGSGTSRLLDRASSSVAGARKGGSDTTSKVLATLSDLRRTVSDLTPNAQDLSGTQKILGFIPGGKKIRRYFQRYESAQVQLDAIVKSLIDGQDALSKDNASLQQEKLSLWETMGQLNKYAVLAQGIDRELVLQIAELRKVGNSLAAQALETDMLFAVRQRHQDLLTQLAVSIQGYMGMELVRKNNVELIKGVDRARTTTIQALRQAIIVAQALDTQKLVLDQLDAVRDSTEKTILATAQMLRDQSARVHEQASSPAISVEVLTRAFDDIFATLDEIDSFKVKANASMDLSIATLTVQLERAKPQLERARALSGDTAGTAVAVQVSPR
jgi:uncharacterized protein YaaN involved in tellurite resistance